MNAPVAPRPAGLLAAAPLEPCALLLFELGPHHFAVRVDAVNVVAAIDPKSPTTGIDSLGLRGRLLLNHVPATHTIHLTNGAVLPATAQPAAAAEGVALWSLPPGLTALGPAVGGLAVVGDTGARFVLCASALLALAEVEARESSESIAPIDGFDELE